jgi:hypothetical protein
VKYNIAFPGERGCSIDSKVVIFSFLPSVTPDRKFVSFSLHRLDAVNFNFIRIDLQCFFKPWSGR